MFRKNELLDAWVAKKEEVKQLEKAKAEEEELFKLLQIWCQHFGSYEGAEGGMGWWLFDSPMTHDEALAELKKVYGNSFGEPYNMGIGLEFSDGAFVQTTKTRTLVKVYWGLDV